jgi:DNA-binding transcriptional LysR family regulator
MRNLNLDQLHTFETVIGLASFTAAARRLNLSQSTVSVQIRELERRFGVALIERMGKKAYATPSGRALAEAAQRIFRECESAEDAVRHFRDGWIGRVHVGTTNTALMYDLPPVLRKLSIDHPGIGLHVTNMATRESIEGVIQNTIDLALVTLPVENRHLRITPLRAQVLVAILPPGTRDSPDEVTPDYVAKQRLLVEHKQGAVHALVMRWLSGRTSPPHPPMHLGTIEALKAAVEANLGMSIVPDVAVVERTADLVVRPLRPRVPCTLALIEHRAKPNTPALEIVRNALLGLRDAGKFKPVHTRANGAGRDPDRRKLRRGT